MLSKSAITAKYKRAFLKTENTFLWNEVPSEIGDKVRTVTGDIFDRGCVLLFFESPSYFWGIFEGYLYVYDNLDKTYAAFKSIDKVLLPDLKEPGNKSEINSLDIVWQDGRVLTLRVERTTWFFFYSLLKYIYS